MHNQERFDRAKWWIDQGFHLVPIQAHTKHLVKGFGTRSHHIADEPLARRWFLLQDANLGVVLGVQGLACADFDDTRVYEQWKQTTGQDIDTLTEETARGVHVFFVGDDLPAGHAEKVEFKTGGVIMVAPSIHPTGTIYQVIQEVPIARLDAEHVVQLFPFVSAFLSARAEVPPPPRTEVSRKPEALGEDLVSRIKAARSVSLEAETLTTLKGSAPHRYGRCPFHDDEHASFWVDDEARLWGCYATSCPTNAKGIAAHDVINLRQWAKRISVREAIKELANECFPRPPKSHVSRRKK